MRLSFPRGTLGNGARTETEVFLLDPKGNQTREMQGQTEDVCKRTNQLKDVFEIEIGKRIRTVTATYKKHTRRNGEATLFVKGNRKEDIIIEESCPRSFHPPFSIEGGEN